MATEEDQSEALYQPTCLNVHGARLAFGDAVSFCYSSESWFGRWTNFGYALIGASTVIMACQSLHLGPAWIWKRADDTTTVLFTVELLVRIFEKGYLFFVEDDKNWNFFDALVVAISLFSMVMTQQAAATANGQAPNGAARHVLRHNIDFTCCELAAI
eukprot:g15169.t1